MSDWKIVDGASTFDFEDDLFFKIQQAPGTGMAPVDTIRTDFGLLDGALFQRQRVPTKSFQLIGTLKGDDIADLHSRRRALIDRVKPDRSASQQPVIIQYLGSGSTLQASAFYISGLEFSPNVERNIEADIALGFEMLDPYWESPTSSSATLEHRVQVADTNYILQRDTTGSWLNMNDGMNAAVRSVISGSDGTIYATGEFTEAGGNSANYIASWDGSNWSNLGTGLNNNGLKMKIGPDGTVYVVGIFDQAGGGEASGIAAWDGSSWSDVDKGSSAAGGIEDIAIGKDNSIFIGGPFSFAGSTACTLGIAVRPQNTGDWAKVGEGISTQVDTIAINRSACALYAGGAFDILENGSTACSVALWDGTAWEAMASGMEDGGVTILGIGVDGTVYAGGAFTLAGGIDASGIARWNGTGWSPMGLGVNNNPREIVADISTGLVHVGGEFTEADGKVMGQGYAVWNGTNWLFEDIIAASTAPIIYGIDIQDDGTLTLGTDSGSGIAIAGGKTVINTVGTAKTFPIITMKGPGRVHKLTNYSTNQAIYFDLVLNTGEIATMDLRIGQKTFSSNFRPNLLSTILPPSNFITWHLLGGNNNIVLLINDTSASAEISWTPRYWSLDGNA